MGHKVFQETTRLVLLLVLTIRVVIWRFIVYLTFIIQYHQVQRVLLNIRVILSLLSLQKERVMFGLLM
jgi:hypothetical protein